MIGVKGAFQMVVSCEVSVVWRLNGGWRVATGEAPLSQEEGREAVNAKMHAETSQTNTRCRLGHISPRRF